MKFFIDSANIDEIKKAHDLGIVDGVTTNPSLIAKEKGNILTIINNICDIIDGPISIEIISQDTLGIIKEAKKLSRLNKNIVIKVPMTMEGIKATKQLSMENIKTNVTLIFSPVQALIAAKAGATYVSPFIGRIDDLTYDGAKIIKNIITIYKNYKYKTEIIAASIRTPIHVMNSAILGADIVTIPIKTLEKLYQHPLTKKGLCEFLSDWEKSKNKI